MNNIKFSKEEKQVFYGDFPIVVQSLPSKTTLAVGDVVGVDIAGNYGKYDETTYTTPYGIAMADVIHTTGTVNCETVLSAYLMTNFVKLSSDEGKKLKLIQELRKIGIFLR